MRTSGSQFPVLKTFYKIKMFSKIFKWGMNRFGLFFEWIRCQWTYLNFWIEAIFGFVRLLFCLGAIFGDKRISRRVESRSRRALNWPKAFRDQSLFSYSNKDSFNKNLTPQNPQTDRPDFWGILRTASSAKKKLKNQLRTTENKIIKN